MSLITVDRQKVLELRRQADYAVMIMDSLMWCVEQGYTHSQIADYINEKVKDGRDKLYKAANAELFEIAVVEKGDK